MSKDNVESACVSCSHSHLTTVSAILSEAARMAKTLPMDSPEIQKRIIAVEKELGVWERFDVSPEALSKVQNEKEKKILRNTLNRVRQEIRHQLEISKIRWGSGSVEDLENIASSASDIDEEFRREIAPFYLDRIEKHISTGQTSVSDNTWIWWIVGGALAGFMGWLVFRKKEEEVV